MEKKIYLENYKIEINVILVTVALSREWGHSFSFQIISLLRSILIIVLEAKKIDVYEQDPQSLTKSVAFLILKKKLE